MSAASRKSLSLEKLKKGLAVLEPRWRNSASVHPGIAPWRDLKPGALYEIAGRDWRDGPAASGYALALASRLVKQRPGEAIFIALDHAEKDAGRLYAPNGILGGIDASCLVVCRTQTVKFLLWAAEEAARSSSVSTLIIDARMPHKLLNLTATRRLQLAAEDSGSTPILIRGAEDREPSSAYRRFRISPMPSAPAPHDASAPGPPRWLVEIERCRLGMRGAWLVEWDDEHKEIKEAEALYVSPSAALADQSPCYGKAVA